ncbi:hypothetical protein [uncultured Bosea sp.]|uniref:hypothetical protein n=1 Tax=uncultured Bosea sp. TaxID=211457 RepID=UPI0025D67485|nr:hypothetical protein [uncultured Bosea sp.]
MQAGLPVRRKRRAGRLDVQTFGKIEIDDEKTTGRIGSAAVTAERQRRARTPDRENPLQRLTAFVVVTEQKNDDEASEEASIISERVEEA